MLRIAVGIVLLVVVRFWAFSLDSVVSQSEAYLRIAGILIIIIFAGRLIGGGVELKRRKRLVGRQETVIPAPATGAAAKAA